MVTKEAPVGGEKVVRQPKRRARPRPSGPLPEVMDPLQRRRRNVADMAAVIDGAARKKGGEQREDALKISARLHNKAGLLCAVDAARRRDTSHRRQLLSNAKMHFTAAAAGGNPKPLSNLACVSIMSADDSIRSAGRYEGDDGRHMYESAIEALDSAIDGLDKAAKKPRGLDSITRFHLGIAHAKKATALILKKGEGDVSQGITQLKAAADSFESIATRSAGDANQKIVSRAQELAGQVRAALAKKRDPGLNKVEAMNGRLTVEAAGDGLRLDVTFDKERGMPARDELAAKYLIDVMRGMSQESLGSRPAQAADETQEMASLKEVEEVMQYLDAGGVIRYGNFDKAAKDQRLAKLSTMKRESVGEPPVYEVGVTERGDGGGRGVVRVMERLNPTQARDRVASIMQGSMMSEGTREHIHRELAGIDADPAAAAERTAKIFEEREAQMRRDEKAGVKDELVEVE